MNDSIPFELRAIDAAAVGQLLGCGARTVLEVHACKPDFPMRISMRPATWIAGEVLEYRKRQQASIAKPPRGRRRATPIDPPKEDTTP